MSLENIELGNDPQNPYSSVLLSASAGSGKTYQLAQRFLLLSATGVPPEKILTLTFTNKAAGEMRERVLKLAADLQSTTPAMEKERNKIDIKLRNFYIWSQSQPQLKDFNYAPPISIYETASRLLAHSQSLKMMTIDACFLNWISLYCAEITDFQSFSEKKITIADHGQEAEIDRRAWDFVTRNLIKNDSSLYNDLKSSPVFLDFGFLGLQDRVKSLLGQSPWHPAYPQSSDWLIPWAAPKRSELALLSDKAMQGAWADIAKQVSETAAASINEALASQDLHFLYQGGLLTKDHRVSGKYVRGKKRDLLAEPIEEIESLIKSHIKSQILNDLNQSSSAISRLFSLYINEIWKLKKEKSLLSFSDLGPMARRILESHEALGAQYRIMNQTKHILIDEFQDTSFDQWAVFSPLCQEILAGQGIFSEDSTGPGTVFLVGDPKQSIYGFRNANPVIIETALSQLEPMGLKKASISSSYRSSPGIMDFCNLVFPTVLGSDFPLHQTALVKDLLVHPGPSEIRITQCEQIGDGKRLSSEADVLAENIAVLLKSNDALVWQKATDQSPAKHRLLLASDIVILFRNTTHMALYQEALAKVGLRSQAQSKSSFLDELVMQDFALACQLLSLPVDKHSLFAFAASPFFNIDPGLLYETFWYKKSHSHFSVDLIRSLLPLDEQKRWQDFWNLRKKQELPTFILRRLFEIFDIETIYGKSYPPQEMQRVKDLLRILYDRTQAFEAEGQISLSALFNRLDEEQPKTDIVRGSLDTVTLLSIHKSKGLEFPFVVLVDAATKWEKRDIHWLKSSTLTHSHWSYVGSSKEQLPSEVCSQWDFKFQEFDQLQMAESNRLLYVAMTRAKQFLWIIGTRYENQSSKSGTILPLILKLCQTSGQEIKEINDSYLQVKIKLASQDKGEKGESIDTSKSETPSFGPPHLPLFYPGLKKGLMVKAAHSATKNHDHPGVAKLSKNSVNNARLLGLCIHKSMESYLKHGSFNVLESARFICRSLENRIIINAEFIAEVERHAHNIINAPEWQGLLLGAKAIYPEMSLGQISGPSLNLGQIDLLIDKGGEGLIILDYKTGHDEGMEIYFDQLRAYAQLLWGVYGQDTPIRAYLVISDTGKFLEDPALNT